MPSFHTDGYQAAFEHDHDSVRVVVRLVRDGIAVDESIFRPLETYRGRPDPESPEPEMHLDLARSLCRLLNAGMARPAILLAAQRFSVVPVISIADYDLIRYHPSEPGETAWRSREDPRRYLRVVPGRFCEELAEAEYFDAVAEREEIERKSVADG